MKSIGWITLESLNRLDRNGGNDSRGTVPLHKDKSATAKVQVFVEDQPILSADQPLTRTAAVIDAAAAYREALCVAVKAREHLLMAAEGTT